MGKAAYVETFSFLQKRAIKATLQLKSCEFLTQKCKKYLNSNLYLPILFMFNEIPSLKNKYIQNINSRNKYKLTTVFKRYIVYFWNLQLVQLFTKKSSFIIFI